MRLAPYVALAGRALEANFRRPRFPFKLTFCITYWCNYRCQTCNIWKKKPQNEFTADEFDRVFQTMGHAPYWFTFSGGEPFLRKDLEAICESAYRHCQPAIISLGSCGRN